MTNNLQARNKQLWNIFSNPCEHLQESSMNITIGKKYEHKKSLRATLQIWIKLWCNYITWNLGEHTPASTCSEPNKGLITCSTYSRPDISFETDATSSCISFHSRHSSLDNTCFFFANWSSSLHAFCTRNTFPICNKQTKYNKLTKWTKSWILPTRVQIGKRKQLLDHHSNIFQDLFLAFGMSIYKKEVDPRVPLLFISTARPFHFGARHNQITDIRIGTYSFARVQGLIIHSLFITSSFEAHGVECTIISLKRMGYWICYK